MTTEIVGVVGDVLKDGLDTKPQPEIYLALNKLDKEHAITREINLVIRTSGDPNAFASSLRSMVREIEPTAALGHVGTLSSQVADSVSEPRFSTAVLTLSRCSRSASRSPVSTACCRTTCRSAGRRSAFAPRSVRRGPTSSVWSSARD